MIIPRAELPFVPDEMIADARAATDRALHERFGRMRDAVEDVFGDVFGIEQHLVVETFGWFGVPTRAHEHFEVAQRADERALVFGRERLVDPTGEVVGGDVNALP